MSKRIKGTSGENILKTKPISKTRTFYFLTLFPVELTNWLIHSISLKAIYRSEIVYKVINIRQGWNQQVDFPAYGGQGGMVISIKPIYELLEKNKLIGNSHIILLCPRGKKFTQSRSRELEKISIDTPLVFLCGHYEGIDERIEHFISERLSIGDYIISSGTLAAVVILEGIIRLIPNVISEESLEFESFNNSEDSSDLDFPCFAPPKDFLGYKVPENLGNFFKKKTKTSKK